MLVTVAINTWNRAKLLAETLDHFTRVEIPHNTNWELVLVNNNSTDDTDKVAERFAGRLPIKYIHEPRQGTSFAKNAALEAASGSLTLWTDDDVRVGTQWIRALIDAAAAHPNASIFGGVIRPWYGSTPPTWLASNLDLVGVVWALLDLGAGVRPLSETELVFGANMGFRTAALKSYRFRTDLGDVGGRVRKGEETDLVMRMRADGHQAVWVGEAVVDHYILPERLNSKYIRQLLSNTTYQLFDPASFRGIRTLWGVPRYLIRRYLLARSRSILLAPGRSRSWLKAHIEAARTWGEITAAWAARSIVQSAASGTS